MSQYIVRASKVEICQTQRMLKNWHKTQTFFGARLYFEEEISEEFAEGERSL